MLAGVLLIPGAFLLAVGIGTVVGGIATLVLGTGPIFDEPTIPTALAPWVLLFSWAVLLYWATATDSLERTLARAFWVLCIGSFLLPVIGITHYILGPPDPPDAWFPKWFILALSIFFGLPGGLICFPIAKMVAPRGSPEKSIWYVFRPVGGRWVALAMGLLLVAAIVLHQKYGWEGLV